MLQRKATKISLYIVLVLYSYIYNICIYYTNCMIIDDNTMIICLYIIYTYPSHRARNFQTMVLVSAVFLVDLQHDLGDSKLPYLGTGNSICLVQQSCLKNL